MELKEAVAGTLESGDMLVRIGPGEGLQVELQSSVEAQFGRRIRAVIRVCFRAVGGVSGRFCGFFPGTVFLRPVSVCRRIFLVPGSAFRRRITAGSGLRSCG